MARTLPLWLLLAVVGCGSNTYVGDTGGGSTTTSNSTTTGSTTSTTGPTTTPVANCNRLVESNYSGNGLVEGGFRMFFDADGFPDRAEQDLTGNGTVNVVWDYVYDANGRQLLSAFDADGDGLYDNETTFEYDGNGNVTVSRIDVGVDGSFESVAQYAYDDAQRLAFLRFDYNDNGTVNWTHEYLYTGAAGLDGQVVQFSNEDNVIRIRTTSTYDDQNLLTQVVDNGDNGVVNLSVTRSWLAQGRPDAMTEVDYNAAGVEERTIVSSWTYDSVYTERVARVDHAHTNPDGVTRSTWDVTTWTCP